MKHHTNSKWVYASMLMPGLLLMSNSTFSHLNPFATNSDPSVVIAAGTVPDAFAFAPVIGAERNTVVQSNAITISGLDSPSPISITGGEYSISGGAFTSTPGTVNNGDTVVVEQMSSGVLLTPTTATLTIGGVSSDFTVTTTNQFSFLPQFNVPLSTLVESEHVGLYGNPDSPVAVSIVGGEYSLNGGAFTTANGTMQYGDDLVVRQLSSATNNTTTTTTLTLGRVTGTFAVTTLASTDPVDPFAFTSLTNIALSTPVDSNTITVSGTTGPTPISIVGGLYSINGGAFTSAPGTVNNGETVVVQQTSAATFSTTTTATLTIGSFSADFNATTLAGDITPDPFAFLAQTGVTPNTTVTSNAITVSGIDSPSPISISGGQYSINGGAFTSTPGTVNNGETVVVQQTSAAGFLLTTTATLTIDSVNANFDVTTAAPDITPDQFAFTAETGAPLSTLVTSTPITITGINAPSPISIVGGEYSINGGAFTAATGTVNSGDVVRVQLMTAASNLLTTTATLTVDSVNADFNVTTLGSDITPDPFTFTAQTGVALSSPIDSNTITVSGINAPSPISIVGGLYSINGGAFTSTSGTVNNGDTVAVQIMSSALPLTTSTATLTIDSMNSDFNVTTLGSDITPDIFTFANQTGVALNTQITSNAITVSGINAPSPIQVVNGEYSINGGSFTTSPGTVNNGDTVTVRILSSANFNTQTLATLIIDGVSSDFAVTTVANNTTAVFDSIPEPLNAVIGQPFTFTFHASKANGAPVTYTLLGAPQGATIDANTGVFTWTPNALGTFSFDVVASDEATLHVTINVTAVPVVTQTESRGGNGHCGSYVCRQFHKYAQRYNNDDSRDIYMKVRELRESNPVEFERLRSVYMKYKKFSSDQIQALSEKVKADFFKYKNYNGYKQYKHFKDRK